MNKFACFLLVFGLSTHFVAPCYAQNTLQYYIVTAQKNSPLIKDNNNQTDALKVEINRIKANYTSPQLTLSGNLLVAPVYSRNDGNQGLKYTATGLYKYTGYESALTNGGLYQGLLTVTQPLFNDIRYKTEAEQAEAQIKLRVNNNKLTVHDIERMVTGQYILCLQDYQQAQYLDTLLTFIKEQREVVKQLAQTGVAKISDIKLLDIEYNTQLTILKSYQAAYHRDFLDLYIISGIEDTTTTILPSIDLQLKPDIIRSAFLERYRLDSLNLITQQKVSELKYKPQVNLFANGGLNANYIPTIPNRFGVSAGINLTIFLFDGHQKEMNRSKTNILLKSSGEYEQTFITQNTVRKNNILEELQSLNERISITRRQVQDYETLLKYYKQELIRGQLSVIDYINTLKNFSTLQKDLALMDMNRQLLINNYNYWNW